MKPKSVLITGGASGLGLEMAKIYIQKLCNVTIIDIKDPHLDGSNFIHYDLWKKDEAFIKNNTIYDVVIINAGISASGNFVEMPNELEEDIFTINATSHLRLIKQLLRQKSIANSGSIVFICSATMFVPFPIALAYSASKGALKSFADSLESYVLDANISVTRVFPGPMKTAHTKYYKQFDKGKGADAKKVAIRIVKAVDHRKRNVYPDTISKASKIVSVIFPTLLVKIMHKQYKNVMY